MGAHVPAIGKQRHRTCQNPGDYLNEHGNSRQNDHIQSSSFIFMSMLAKIVTVKFIIDIICCHAICPFCLISANLV